MPRVSFSLAVALVATLAIVAFGCDAGSTEVPHAATTLEAAAARGPFAVGVTTRTIVDATRPTQANGDFAGAPDRTLTVDIWYPATGDVTADELPARGRSSTV